MSGSGSGGDGTSLAICEMRKSSFYAQRNMYLCAATCFMGWIIGRM